LATFGTDYGYEKTYPSYVESPVVRQGEYLKITIEDEDDFWRECELMIEELQGYGTAIPSEGRVYYDMAKMLRVDPHILNLDSASDKINRFNRISKPSYLEYDNLPSLWVDCSGLIERELNMAMEVYQLQRHKK